MFRLLATIPNVTRTKRECKTLEAAVSELCERLREVVAILHAAEDAAWPDWFEKLLARIEQGKLSAVGDLLGCYGGMSSFNDLVLTPVNGHRVEADEEYTINNRLDALRRRMYDLASEIERRRKQKF